MIKNPFDQWYKQSQRKRLTGRPVAAPVAAARRPVAVTINYQDIRSRIAEATHQAVCKDTGTDGAQSCHLYSWVGSLLASRCLGARHWAVAGSIYLHHCAEDFNYAFACESSNGGFQRGEIHCWIVQQDELVGHPYNPTKIVDLSSRNYRRFTERAVNVSGILPLDTEYYKNSLEGERPWTVEEPPTFVWSNPSDLPRWLRLRFDPEATKDIWYWWDENRDAVRRLVDSAFDIYDDLSRGLPR